MTESERRQIIELIKKEVIPAIGCTEPIAVALCVAKAAETLGAKPEKIEVLLSANILKNAMGVGIPGTGMVGLPIAVALGALIGKSDYQLEVLRDCTPEAVEQGKQFIAEKRICISLKEDITEKLYIEVICKTEDKTAKAIIAGGHTTFIYIAKNEQTLLDKQQTVSEEEEEASPELNLRKVYDFALTAPLDEIRFILDTARLNKAAAEQAFKGNYGHSLGKMLRGTYEHKVMGDSVFSHILSYTSAACDARMAGAMIPVMSNSGSGNQGISATLPVVVFAEVFLALVFFSSAAGSDSCNTAALVSIAFVVSFLVSIAFAFPAFVSIASTFAGFTSSFFSVAFSFATTFFAVCADVTSSAVFTGVCTVVFAVVLDAPFFAAISIPS